MPLEITENNTIVRIEEEDRVIIAEPDVTVITIEAGTPGVKGDKGDPGESVEFLFPVANTTWTVVHNLDRYPAAWEIYDTANTNYQAGAQYIDSNTMQFTFSAALAGRVVLF